MLAASMTIRLRMPFIDTTTNILIQITYNACNNVDTMVILMPESGNQRAAATGVGTVATAQTVSDIFTTNMARPTMPIACISATMATPAVERLIITLVYILRGHSITRGSSFEATST
eukprot:GHVU01180872.1.p2 GENE.GHVU01180872.1~~GHVU01180872.1.p2  ORF type:complete len:117 (-),score=9.66 GHVU01180872.1:428-778(-)